MSEITIKNILPYIACSVYGSLIAVGAVNHNYPLLLLIVGPVLLTTVISLVLNNPHLTDSQDSEVLPVVFSDHNSVLFPVLFLVAGVLGLNYYALSNPTITQRILASAIIALGIMPTFIYMKYANEGVPFVSLFGAIYAIYYGLPVFLVEDFQAGKFIISGHSFNKSLYLSVLGILVLYLAYYCSPLRRIIQKSPRINIQWDTRKASSWAVIFGVLGIFANYSFLILNIPAMFQQPLMFIVQLSIMGTGILFILYLKGNLNRPGIVFLFCFLLPANIFLRLGTGLISGVLLLIIFMFLTFWTFRKRIPWKTTIIGIIALLVLLSVKSDFRGLTWEGEHAAKNPVEKSLIFANMALSKQASIEAGLKLAAFRISHLLSFAHVVEKTPSAVPYWNGATYKSFLWTPVPRIIYPDKPTKELGQEFGHRYGILNPLDTSTSCNMPQLIELYANFGSAGVAIGMFIIGMIYRLIQDIFCHKDAGEGGLLIGITLFTSLANIESDFSLVFGGLFYNSILLVLISKLIRKTPLTK